MTVTTNCGLIEVVEVWIVVVVTVVELVVVVVGLVVVGLVVTVEVEDVVVVVEGWKATENEVPSVETDDGEAMTLSLLLTIVICWTAEPNELMSPVTPLMVA